MKRLLVLCGAVAFCSMLGGCSSNPQSEAIQAVVNRMNEAAGDINNIKDQVNAAIKKHEEKKAPFDLTEATKMAEKLQTTAKAAQELQVKQIEHIKVGAQEKEELDRQFRTPINNAFADLLKAKTELNQALQKADAIDHDKVEDLRSKIREAEGPFETLARQG